MNQSWDSVLQGVGRPPKNNTQELNMIGFALQKHLRVTLQEVALMVGHKG